ncbi:14-3-3 protein homolog 2-like isoform X1 [Haliotis rufescens]|uniref:14-3-3 protein homolog 2-like isoform X1 n=1 Tax=Haliotis rufescens TaxID=6454 RepID=UPI00201EDAF6|nr:14-3-3 protein homolog 2-like isoform X1 [Haliotis rufescens]
MAESPEKMLMRVQLAEQGERFDEMMGYARRLVQDYPDYLDKHGKLDLLSVAFKNAVGERRAAWRVMKNIVEQCTGKDTTDQEDEVKKEKARKDEGSEVKRELAKEYMDVLDREITNICEDLLTLLDKHLLDAASSPDTRVLLLKLKGDYPRYMAEIQSGEKRTVSVTAATTAYQEAMELAMNELLPTHPHRLGLILNISLFYYSILDSREKACHIGQKGVDSAEANRDTADKETWRESSRLIQVIKDNVETWTSE